jgi:tetratricopeptide (TPR) repeat protein
MTGAIIRRVAICAVAAGLIFIPRIASAQSGSIKGKVVDPQGAPVEGAKIEIQSVDKGGRPLEVKTKKDGTYMQVGLSPGQYKLTASKGDLADTQDVHVGLDMMTKDFHLGAKGAAGAAGASKEDVAKAKAKVDATNKAFVDGVDLLQAGKDDEAIAKFNEVIAVLATCHQCYGNIGTALAHQKKYEEAEAAYKKAVEIKPDYADAYNGLVNVYNAEKKFPQAEEAGKKAMELSATAAGPAGAAGATGGSASAPALYNQGVILWNQNKAPEAAEKFDAAVKADATYADAHYMLGKALINQGKLPEAAKEYQEYLKLAPNGQYKDDASKTLEMLKPYIK